MRAAIFDQPALQQHMGNLFQALLQSPPEYSSIHLVVEARKAYLQTSILFTLGSPEAPEQYTTLVPDPVANAAFQVMGSLLQEDNDAPGFEIVLRKTSATNWETDFHSLGETGPQWADLPRYPLRVTGHGYSLAPPADKIYRWARNATPPAIIGAARKAQEAAFKQVQITFADAGPRVLLRDGASTVEEVIQVSEGPSASHLGTNQWTIETPAFRAVWPEGLDLRSPLASRTHFDLLGPDDAMVFVQGPVANNDLLDEMAVEGQKEIGRGKTRGGHEWIDLQYRAGGAQWRQRHTVCAISRGRAFVVTAQSLEAHAKQIFQASDELTDSLTEIAS